MLFVLWELFYEVSFVTSSVIRGYILLDITKRSFSQSQLCLPKKALIKLAYFSVQILWTLFIYKGTWQSIPVFNSTMFMFKKWEIITFCELAEAWTKTSINKIKNKFLIIIFLMW